MKKILSLLIIIAMMLAMSLNSIAYADSFSEEGEIIVNDFGATPNKTTPDDTVKLFGYSTAKWDTSANPSLSISGTYNADADTYLNLTIYNPTEVTDKNIALYLGTAITADNDWAKAGRVYNLNIDRKGWKSVNIPLSSFRIAYNSTANPIDNIHNYTFLQLIANQYGANFNAELNIGKIWFSKSSVTNNAYTKGEKLFQQNEIAVNSGADLNIWNGYENVYKISFEYKTEEAVSAENSVYAALELPANEGSVAPAVQPIWVPTDTEWHIFSFEIPEKFNMSKAHIKAGYTIRDLGANTLKDAGVTIKVKNFIVHTSPYGNAVTLLSSSDKIFVSDYAYIAASSAICAGKDAIVTVKNSSGTAVSSSYDIIQNKILIDFEKSAGTTYTIEYSGFYDIEGANEFSGTTAVSVLPNQFKVSYKGETTTDGITRTYSYINGSGEGKNAIVILAVYSSGNVLDKVFINNEDVILANNTYSEISVSVSSAQLGDTTGKTIKSFVFGDLKDIKPLCKAE